MPLHQTIKDQVRDALRAKDIIKLDTLRGLTSLFQNELMSGSCAPGTEYLPDDKALALIKRSVKQRKDSIEQFRKGGREDLATKEQEELAILESYLPAMMSRGEVHIIASERLEKLKSAGQYDPKAAGKITGMIMKELAGKADGAVVKSVVEELMAAPS